MHSHTLTLILISGIVVTTAELNGVSQFSNNLIMKKQVVLIGLDEPEMITDVSLGSDGISTYGENHIVGKPIATHETELDARKHIEQE